MLDVVDHVQSPQSKELLELSLIGTAFVLENSGLIIQTKLFYIIHYNIVHHKKREKSHVFRIHKSSEHSLSNNLTWQY